MAIGIMLGGSRGGIISPLLEDVLMPTGGPSIVLPPLGVSVIRDGFGPDDDSRLGVKTPWYAPASPTEGVFE